jgi:NHL repeat
VSLLISSRFTRRLRTAVVALAVTGSVVGWASPAQAVVSLGDIGLGVGQQAGLLDSPAGVAVDAAGRVYVAEFANERVSVFSSQGTFMRAFGKDVVPGNGQTGIEVCTQLCQAGAAGSRGGELSNPAGVAVHPAALDSSGTVVYVAEFSNNRISVFTGNGTFLRAFGKRVSRDLRGSFDVCVRPLACAPGKGDGSAGAIHAPDRLDVGTAGNLYIAEVDSRVSVFTPAGTFVRAFGKDVVPDNAQTGAEVCTTRCKAGLAGDARGELGLPTRCGNRHSREGHRRRCPRKPCLALLGPRWVRPRDRKGRAARQREHRIRGVRGAVQSRRHGRRARPLQRAIARRA